MSDMDIWKSVKRKCERDYEMHQRIASVVTYVAESGCAGIPKKEPCGSCVVCEANDLLRVLYGVECYTGGEWF